MKLFKEHLRFSGVEKPLAELDVLVQIAVDGVHHISDVFNRIVEIVEEMTEVLDGLVFNLLEDIVNVAVMGVKGAPVDTGGGTQLLDRDALDRFLLQQLGKGLPDEHPGHPHPVVGIFQKISPYQTVGAAGVGYLDNCAPAVYCALLSL